MQVKVRLFKALCICFYDAALRQNFSNGAILKLTSAYNKCMKSFFGTYNSVTGMLLTLGLSSFTTLMHNYDTIVLDLLQALWAVVIIVCNV